MVKYIAYYRVSTKRQGTSGLGLEAQKDAVKRYSQESIVAEYTEVESGKKDKRVELLKALDHCQRSQAILLVAKMDRLSRNASFLFALKDSGVKFECCDVPQLTTMTLAIYAGMAQQERELISQRTKAALAVKRAQGVKLGSPQNLSKEAMAKGQRKHQELAKEKPANTQAYALIQALRSKGLSMNAIAKRLNEAGYKTARGGKYLHTTVAYLIKMFESKKV